jgi:hypothetical protein
MKQVMRGSFFLPVGLACFSAHISAQNFLYSNDNPVGANTVSGYAVADDGSLSAVPGSPLPTGGAGEGGGYFASERVAASAVGNLLYVSNGGSNSISGFSIDAGTGALTLVPGSPFPTGGVSGGRGIGLAITADGSFLFAGHGTSNNFRVFSISSDGSLTPVGPIIPAGGSVAGLKATPIVLSSLSEGPAAKGYLLGVLTLNGPHGSIGVWGIDAGGGLTPAQGSPFLVRLPGGPDGAGAGIDVACDGTTVAVGEATLGSTLVDVFDQDLASGALTARKGSPFSPGVGVNSSVVLFSAGSAVGDAVNDSFLFVSNQGSNTVTALNNGDFSLLGAFSAGGTPDQVPAGMAADQAGAHLYAGKYANFVAVFNVGSDGSLTLAPGSPVSTLQPPGLLDVAAFPPKSCAAAAGEKWPAAR